MGIRAQLDALDRRFGLTPTRADGHPWDRRGGPTPLQSAFIKHSWVNWVYAAVVASLAGLVGAGVAGDARRFSWPSAGTTFVVLLVLGLWQTRRLRSEYRTWASAGEGVDEPDRSEGGDATVD